MASRKRPISDVNSTERVNEVPWNDDSAPKRQAGIVTTQPGLDLQTTVRPASCTTGEVQWWSAYTGETTNTVPASQRDRVVFCVETADTTSSNTSYTPGSQNSVPIELESPVTLSPQDEAAHHCQTTTSTQHLGHDIAFGPIKEAMPQQATAFQWRSLATSRVSVVFGDPEIAEQARLFTLDQRNLAQPQQYPAYMAVREIQGPHASDRSVLERSRDNTMHRLDDYTWWRSTTSLHADNEDD
ncbi:hypothetical protein MBLNU459_g3473t1 [Dothideomycetes sp. NU459]